MVHADAITLPENASKADAYRHIIEQMKALMEGQRNWVCNLANASSLLWHAYKSLPDPSNSVNWAGFYTLDPTHPSQLILGPFQGRVACQTIAFARGVCGRAAADQKIQLVPDVDRFPGHIACDGDTRSEIVVPVVVGGRTVAVVDVDCSVVDGFDPVDVEGLRMLADLLAEGCDW